MTNKNRTDMFSEGNKISEEYDYLILSIPHYVESQRHVGLALLENFSTKDSLKILELGPGTGLTTLEIMKVLPNSSLVAVDGEEVMLKQAKAREIQGNIEFVHDDGLEFLKKIGDNTFDGVVSAYVIHNFEHAVREVWIQEIYRVLKPNGIFINADKYVHDDEEEYRRIYDKQIQMFDVYEKIGKTHLKKEWIDHYAIDAGPNIRQVEGRFKEILKENGFIDIRMTYREMLDGIIVGKKPSV